MVGNSGGWFSQSVLPLCWHRQKVDFFIDAAHLSLVHAMAINIFIMMELLGNFVTLHLLIKKYYANMSV